MPTSPVPDRANHAAPMLVFRFGSNGGVNPSGFPVPASLLPFTLHFGNLRPVLEAVDISAK